MGKSMERYSKPYSPFSRLLRYGHSGLASPRTIGRCRRQADEFPIHNPLRFLSPLRQDCLLFLLIMIEMLVWSVIVSLRYPLQERRYFSLGALILVDKQIIRWENLCEEVLRVFLSLAWFAFSKEIWLQLKNTTAGRLPNDLMSNSLGESWERMRNVACRAIFVNIVEIIFEGKEKQKQDLALHINHHPFWPYTSYIHTYIYLHR